MNEVRRHSLAVRINHWTVAISGLLLVMTGMGELPMYKRYFITAIPGLKWLEDFALLLQLHYVFGLLFTAACVFHVVFHVRRNEFACLPRRGDVSESLQIVKAMLKGKEEPPHGKFLAEQRLAYLAILGATLGLIVTGLIKSYKNLGPITLDPTFLQVVTLLHTGLTMLFVLLVVLHVAAFALKANRPLLPSMITGVVSRKYAERRHPLWKFSRRGEA